MSKPFTFTVLAVQISSTKNFVVKYLIFFAANYKSTSPEDLLPRALDKTFTM